MNRPIFLTSFLSTCRSGSKCLTSPAIWHANSLGSNCEIRAIPLSPPCIAVQHSSVPAPTELRRPIPLTTTLRGPIRSLGLLLLRLDVNDGVFHGLDLLGVLIRYVQVERFLERHHQLDDVERIRA